MLALMTWNSFSEGIFQALVLEVQQITFVTRDKRTYSHRLGRAKNVKS
jgi:hypothetical protein